MRQLVRNSLAAAAIAIAVALVIGLIFQMGTSGTALFVFEVALIAFIGTLVINSLIVRLREESFRSR